MADTQFTSEWSRTRVVFGLGALARLGSEIDALGLTRVLLVTTAGRGRALAPVRDEIGARLGGVCDRAVMHVPVATVTAALADVDRLKPDALVAFGGGSAIGLAKGIARQRPLPIIAVPTTYAGSEMTSIWGVTDGDRKSTGRDPAVAPRLVIYDPMLTLSLPAHTSAASGMNAVAHAVEAMYAPHASPIPIAAAEEALRTLSRALPAVVASPHELDARTQAFRGAHAAGVALELAPMGLHHKLCHVLGGLGLPHAETHAALLPHVVDFNAPGAPETMTRITAALGSTDAAGGLRALNQRLGLVTSLAALGLKREDIARAAQSVAGAVFPNPRSVSAESVEALLQHAL